MDSERILELINIMETMAETMRKITIYHKGYEDGLQIRLIALEERFNAQEKILKERELI